ncbi:MAG: MFS transporter [Gammaproteobacteria bacterium]|jgi:MFS family permease
MQQSNDKITILGCFIWLLAASFFLYEFFLRTFIGTIADEITSSLHLGAEQLSLIGAAYFVTYGIMQAFVGVLIDSFGIKKLLAAATFICVAGVFLFTFAQGFILLLIARLLMGFGSAFGFVSLLMLSLNWFPHKHFGFIAGLSQLLGAVGPLLAGAPLVILLTSLHNNWRIVLGGIGVTGLLIGCLIWIFVRDFPKNVDNKIIYLNKEKPIYKKLINLFRNTQAWLIIIYATLANSSLAILGIVWGTTYLETHNFSQKNAALVSSLIWAGYAIGCPILGFISDFLKQRKLPMLICASLGLVASIFTIYTPINNIYIFSLIFFCLGIAGSGQSLAFAIMSERIRPETHATGFGINNGLLMLSTTLLIPLFGLFIKLSQPHASMKYQSENFILGLSMMLVIYIVAITICFFIKETYCRQQTIPVKLDTEK